MDPPWRRRRGRRRRTTQGPTTTDATEGLIWLVARALIGITYLYAVGGVLVALKASGAPVITGRPWAVVFAPIFAASVAIVATQARVFARAASLKLHKAAAAQYGTAGDRDAIHEDALPLLRRGIVATALSVPATWVLFAAEVLACEALSSSPATAPRAARGAAACALSLETAVLVAAVVLKGRGLEEARALDIASAVDEEDAQLQNKWWRRRPSGILGATLHGLVWLFLVRAARLAGRRRSLFDDDDGEYAEAWARALLPLWLAAALLVVSLLTVLRRHAAGRYRLARPQLFCVGLYVLASACFASAAYLSLGPPLGCQARSIDDAARRRDVTIAGLAAASGVAAAAVGLHVAFVQHATQLARSRGHGATLPLAKTREGFWAPSGAGESFWFLLGSFERLELPRPRSASSLRALSGGASPSAGSAGGGSVSGASSTGSSVGGAHHADAKPLPADLAGDRPPSLASADPKPASVGLGGRSDLRWPRDLKLPIGYARPSSSSDDEQRRLLPPVRRR